MPIADAQELNFAAYPNKHAAPPAAHVTLRSLHLTHPKMWLRHAAAGLPASKLTTSMRPDDIPLDPVWQTSLRSGMPPEHLMFLR